MELIKRPLLITAGKGTGVVLQAYMLVKDEIDSVYVFGTDNEESDYSLIIEYFKKNNLLCEITIIEGYKGVLSATEHYIYEEILFRWYLSHLKNADPYVCISGGTKSMTACMYKAAHLFGAHNVFHVLNEVRTSDLEQMILQLEQGLAYPLKMGHEPGWNSFRYMHGIEFETHEYSVSSNGIFKIKKDISPILTQKISDIISRVQSQFSNASEKEYPFQSLMLLSTEQIAWLHQKIQLLDDSEWLRNLPEIDLHCHLGGFATRGFDLEKVRQSAKYPEKLNSDIQIDYPVNWPIPDHPVTLDAYMHLGDTTGSNLLKDEGCLECHVRLLYNYLNERGVFYAEIRCSPDNYKTAERSSWMVLKHIIDTFNDCMESEHAQCHINLILIATRKSNGDMSSINRHLALALTAEQHYSTTQTKNAACRIVGVDLAGYESKETRAGYFMADFTGIHRSGLAITAHAGENDGAEGIWEAVYKLNARRLGHALHLADSPSLLQNVIDRKIGVEMCPLANFQIKGYAPMSGGEQYPMKQYLDAGVMVTINTDNIGISEGDIFENIQMAVKMCPGLTRMDLLKMIRNAIEQSFVSDLERKNLVMKFEKKIFMQLLKIKMS